MFLLLTGLDGSRVVLNGGRVLCCVKRLDRSRVLRTGVVLDTVRCDVVWVLEEPVEVFGQLGGVLCSDLDGNGVVFNGGRVLSVVRGVDGYRRLGTCVTLDVPYYNTFWVREDPGVLFGGLCGEDEWVDGGEFDEGDSSVGGDSSVVEEPVEGDSPVEGDELVENPTESGVVTLDIKNSVVLLGGRRVDIGGS